MDYDKLIERLRNAAGGPEGIQMCQDAATAIEALQAESIMHHNAADNYWHELNEYREERNEALADLARVTAERDGAIKAVKNMAEYIVCAGRVDYFLCDEISQEHHLKYQPKNDGNYDNEPCYKCIEDWFLQGNKW